MKNRLERVISQVPCQVPCHASQHDFRLFRLGEVHASVAVIPSRCYNPGPMNAQWKKLSDLTERDLTPMMRQFIEAKAGAEGSILLFRMGDFFELFFEDAVEAAEILGLTLTSRDGAGKGDRVPMAGVPARAVDGYIAKLIRAGRTVAICDQIEDPREAKGVVKRAIVRTVTPGTVMEPDLLDEAANNYLAAIAFDGDAAVPASAGLAFIDITTGEFLAAQVDGHGPDGALAPLVDELVRMQPAEVLVSEEIHEDILKRLGNRFDSLGFRTRTHHDFAEDIARDRLLDQFSLKSLKGVGLDDAPQALACAGAVLHYIHETQRDAVPQLRMPRRYTPSSFVVLDGNTQRNLEIVESMLDKRKRGSLLGVLDRTQTSMGGRKLRYWLLHPLVEVDAIRERLTAVEALFMDTERRLELTEALRGIADLERLLGRLTARSGNARDVKALGQSLERIPGIKAAIHGADSPMLAALHDGMDALEDIATLIAERVVDEPPLTVTEGNLLKDGWHDELDRLRGLVRGGRDWIATLQREESARCGIPNLKVGYNKVFGYYIEVSKAHSHKVPDDFERKQTLVNAERYITPQLKEREEEIVTAQERMQTLEYDLFSELRDAIAAQALRIQDTAEALATVDVLRALAETASACNYAKPEIDDGDIIAIKDGRHPVVEDLMRGGGDFVPNDSDLDPAKACLHIVTGPNMAGKSTYLRQVALITLMAQVGSFVPASAARIGVVDRIFTRVGASDNLARGESTFMVEMIETAAILNAATKRSLLVLDEIGRGTSTFDGISIAWSVAEHIHDKIGAKTLFATHYHELTELVNQLERAKNLSVAVREYGGTVIFLYRIVDGGADHSYGIQVARLAGLPPAVIARAREVLDQLESGNTAALGLPQQLSLFGAVPTAKPSPALEALHDLDPDSLSPKEAHELLYRLRRLAEEDKR